MLCALVVASLTAINEPASKWCPRATAGVMRQPPVDCSALLVVLGGAEPRKSKLPACLSASFEAFELVEK